MKLTLIVFLTAFLLFASNALAQTQKKPAIKITGIQAKLFYENKATFSDDILAKKDLALWNTIIGEGSAGAPSGSTLVLVEVRGAYPEGFSGNYAKVEFTATGEKGKVFVKRSTDVAFIDDKVFYAPFWLYDTGCGHIKLSARIIYNGVASTPTVKTIPFECGE